MPGIPGGRNCRRRARRTPGWAGRAWSFTTCRPVCHRKRDSTEAHLSVVFAALAVSRWIENATGWSIRRFVRTARRYRTIQIQAGPHVLTAADPLPDDLRQVLAAITSDSRDNDSKK